MVLHILIGKGDPAGILAVDQANRKMGIWAVSYVVRVTVLAVYEGLRVDEAILVTDVGTFHVRIMVGFIKRIPHRLWNYYSKEE